MRSIILIVFLLVAIAMPVSGFTADQLAVRVLESGDAEIVFDYRLTWIERVVVFSKIADPKPGIQRTLEGMYTKPVHVNTVTTQSTSITVRGLATIHESDMGRVYTVPGIDFSKLTKNIDKYWFAPLISIDLSPSVTIVTFPDGTTQYFSDVTALPPISHTVVS